MGGDTVRAVAELVIAVDAKIRTSPTFRTMNPDLVRLINVIRSSNDQDKVIKSR